MIVYLMQVVSFRMNERMNRPAYLRGLLYESLLLAPAACVSMNSKSLPYTLATSC